LDSRAERRSKLDDDTISRIFHDLK